MTEPNDYSELVANLKDDAHFLRTCRPKSPGIADRIESLLARIAELEATRFHTNAVVEAAQRTVAEPNPAPDEVTRQWNKWAGLAADPVAYLSPMIVDNFVVDGYETCGPKDYGAFPVYMHPHVAHEPVAWMNALGLTISAQTKRDMPEKVAAEYDENSAYAIPCYTHPMSLADLRLLAEKMGMVVVARGPVERE